MICVWYSRELKCIYNVKTYAPFHMFIRKRACKQSSLKEVQHKWHDKPISDQCSIWYPLKKPDKLWLFSVFRGYKIGILAWNGLNWRFQPRNFVKFSWTTIFLWYFYFFSEDDYQMNCFNKLLVLGLKLSHKKNFSASQQNRVSS